MRQAWMRLQGLTVEETLKLVMILRLAKQASELAPATYDSAAQYPVYSSLVAALDYIGVLNLTDDYPPSNRGATSSLVQYVSRCKAGSWNEAAARIKQNVVAMMMATHKLISTVRNDIPEPTPEELEHAVKNLGKALALKLLTSPALELRMVTEYHREGLRIVKSSPIHIKLTTGAIQ